MTENKIPKSCSIKVKSFWSDFYSAPCFWLKVISLTVILGLALFGLYKIVTSAFYYFDEPLSYFDPERLGQLGDFLGGTLNPIFGFATVCLLLWSVFIQRKELSLTRKELKKTVKAQRKQANINQIEFERRQLENAANSCLIELEKLFHKKIFTDFEKAILTGSKQPTTPNVSWNDLLYSSEIAIESKIKDMFPSSTIELEITQIKRILLILKINIFELTRDHRYIKIESIREYWLQKILDLIDDCSALKILNADELPDYKAGIEQPS